MTGRVGMVLGFATAVLLMVGALWGWQEAPELVMRWRLHGDWAAWGARCAAVGVGAAAEVIMLSIIGRWIYKRDLVSDILRLGGVLVVMLAGVTAVALALAGR
jgi:hypothetical protein